MIKEELKKAPSSHFFCIISYQINDVYYQTKIELEKIFSKILFESNPMPQWVSEYNLPTGNKTNIVSFNRKINREELPMIKKETMELEKKYSDKDKLLKIIPGYLSPHNVIIASALDDFHRVYLFHGVFAEIIYKYESQRLIPMENSPDFFHSQEPVYYFTNLREAHVQTIR